MNKWNKILFSRLPSQSNTLTISKSGITFSAKFIKAYELQNKLAIEFYEVSDDKYLIGFKFLDKMSRFGSLALMNNNGTTSKALKAGELVNRNKVLTRIQKEPLKENRVFEIKKSKDERDLFYINLNPIFENSIAFSEVTSLSSDTRGIYRYLDAKDEVIYIGKGVIKNRAKSNERLDWGIKHIEYSEISDEEDMFEWESFHLSKFYDEKGYKPKFNINMGNKTK